MTMTMKIKRRIRWTRIGHIRLIYQGCVLAFVLASFLFCAFIVLLVYSSFEISWLCLPFSSHALRLNNIIAPIPYRDEPYPHFYYFSCYEQITTDHTIILFQQIKTQLHNPTQHSTQQLIEQSTHAHTHTIYIHTQLQNKRTPHSEYAKGVQKIFDQTTSRAQIISTLPSATAPNTITVTWRLSGRVNIGPSGLPIKPYICYTDFTIDEESGLIVFQEDRFDIPGWDILISALFPFLVGRVGFLREAAEEVEERVFDDEDVVAGSGGGRGGVFGGMLKNFGLW